MIIKVGGVPLQPIYENITTGIAKTSSHAYHSFVTSPKLLAVTANATPDAIPANSLIPSTDLVHIKAELVQLGQEVLLATGSVFAVVCGILIVVGLRKEGWKKFADILHGLGVGLIGPTAVTLVAAFFVGISKMLG